MIEFAIGPSHGVVTVRAGRREVRTDVINRRLGVVEVGLVTRNACRIGDVVVAINVAVRALTRRDCVCAGQWKGCLRVIEVRRLPGGGGMAGFAGLRESALDVVWIIGVLEIRQVAGDTRRDGDVVVVVLVAIGASARRNSMRAR